MSKREKIVLVVTAAKPRNRLAIDPLLRKGGVHQKSKSAQRQADKRQLKKSLHENAGSSAFNPLPLFHPR